MTDVVSQHVEPVEVVVNGKWPVWMAPHRAERPEWHTPPYWEGARLDAMHDTVQSWFAESGIWDRRPVIWDVGAEEGDMPALYASWFCDVVLIEPNPKVWPCIRYHWTANQLDPPAGAYVGLVGAAPNDKTRHGEWMIWPPCADGPMYPAHGFHHLDDYSTTDPVTTLDLLLNVFPAPDIVTADIEGGEGHMLRGAQTMLEDVRPVWFLSVHDRFMRDMYGQTAQRHVHDVMESFGYSGEFIEDRHEAHWIYRP